MLKVLSFCLHCALRLVVCRHSGSKCDEDALTGEANSDIMPLSRAINADSCSVLILGQPYRATKQATVLRAIGIIEGRWQLKNLK